MRQKLNKVKGGRGFLQCRTCLMSTHTHGWGTYEILNIVGELWLRNVTLSFVNDKLLWHQLVLPATGNKGSDNNSRGNPIGAKHLHHTITADITAQEICSKWKPQRDLLVYSTAMLLFGLQRAPPVSKPMNLQPNHLETNIFTLHTRKNSIAFN